MKKPSDHLFKLIKSLTKREKRAFRQNAASEKDASKYLAIFDAIDAQEVYDEEAIKLKFKREKWIGRFNAAKDYVYRALLNSLSVYNQKHEPKYELSDFLIHIRVLQSKGFYQRCNKLITKAKKLAIDLDDHLKILELLRLEGNNHPGGVNPVNAEEIRAEQVRILKMLDNEFAFNALYKKSFDLYSKSGDLGFDESTAKAYDELVKHPLLKDYEQALTFRARQQFINIWYFHAVGNRLHNEMHTYILQARALFLSNNKLVRQFKKDQELSELEKLIFRLLHIVLNHLSDYKKAMQIFLTFKTKMQERLFVTAYRFFGIWIKSKLNRRTFEDTARENTF